MIQPKRKAVEYYNELQDRMVNETHLSEFEYKMILKLLSNDKSIEAICSIGFAHVLMGKKDQAINLFKSYYPFSDLIMLKTYGSILLFLGKNKELMKLSLEYENTFHDAWLSWKNMDYYYIIGDISNSAKKAREFLSMLPENENKKNAEYSIAQQLESLHLVYKSKFCTPEQFKVISDLSFDILDKYNQRLRYVEIFYYEGEGASYEIGVNLNDDDFNTLSILNTEVIKRMIEIKELDNCELTPCFSCGGMSKWRYVHVS